MHANTVRIAINFKSVGIWRGYTGNISPELLSIANVIDSIKYEKNTYADNNIRTVSIHFLFRIDH